MRFRIPASLLLLALVSIPFAGPFVRPANGQQGFDPTTLQYVTGTVKSLAPDSIALTQTHNIRNPSSPSVDMTFVLTSDTAYPNRDMVRKEATVMVGYVQQKGKLVAKTVSYLGIMNPGPAGGQSPYPNGVARGPNYQGGGYNSQAIQPRPLAPAQDGEEPQLLPMDTARDFRTLLQRATAIA